MWSIYSHKILREKLFESWNIESKKKYLQNQWKTKGMNQNASFIRNNEWNRQANWIN